jgi:alpha-L-fucosidase
MPSTFEPTWESLKQYRVADWYLDAKFGIFIHWGVYSVPAFGNEWYPRNMYLPGTDEFKHHVATYGAQTKFGYKDFIPHFKGEKFDPSAWVDLFRRAGARYVVPVAEHHDGFAMYATPRSRWNAARMGPCRDVVGELSAAVRQAGLVPGVSSHRAEHWWFMNGGREFESDVQDARHADFYAPATQIITPEWKSTDWQPRPDAKFLEDWLARCCELVDLYQPQVFWFDWWIEQTVFEPYLQRFASHYYNRGAEWGLGVAINYKLRSFPVEAAVWDIERGQLDDIAPHFWQTDTSISKNSWGYVTQQDYKTSTEIIGDLLDIISKNGCLLLNIGPRPDGRIPEAEQQVLLDIGRWLEVNGEAVYGTRPWTVYGEGPTQVGQGSFTDTQRTNFTGQDFRFTRRGETIYAAALAWQGSQAVIRSLGSSAGQVRRVSLLGCPKPLEWRQDIGGLTVIMPIPPSGAHALVFKVEL